MASMKANPSSSPVMAGWNFSLSNQIVKSWKSNSTPFDDEDNLLMGAMLSQKPANGMEMLQNCDLPPPIKVFSGFESERLELLKALRLSQARAREAEAKHAAIAKERDSISNALLKESTQVFAYRQFVKLLEVQVLMVRSQMQEETPQLSGYDCGSGGAKEATVDGGGDGNGLTWIIAVALCLGIAGFGFALSSRHFFREGSCASAC
ncbi:hypothetical protein Ancab_026288 [Ancistrocladus abbreviatus]